MLTEDEKKMSAAFAARVDELRRAAAMKPGAMYKAVGITQGAYSQYKNGISKPSLKTATAFAELFHTTPQYLMFGEKEKPTENSELSPQHRELIDILRRLSPPDIAVLLAAARELAAARQYRDAE